MSVRDFSGAADLFLEAVPTFGSYELMTYENLVFYTVVTSLFGMCYVCSKINFLVLRVVSYSPRSSRSTF